MQMDLERRCVYLRASHTSIVFPVIIFSLAAAAAAASSLIVANSENIYCKLVKCASEMAGFGSLGAKTKNVIVAGGLTGFVFGVYFYTMRAVGGSDELQVAIDKFESQKGKNEPQVISKP